MIRTQLPKLCKTGGVTLQKNMKTVPGYCHTEGLVLSLVSLWTEASARNLSNTSPKSLLTANPQWPGFAGKNLGLSYNDSVLMAIEFSPFLKFIQQMMQMFPAVNLLGPLPFFDDRRLNQVCVSRPRSGNFEHRQDRQSPFQFMMDQLRHISWLRGIPMDTPIFTTILFCFIDVNIINVTTNEKFLAFMGQLPQLQVQRIGRNVGGLPRRLADADPAPPRVRLISDSYQCKLMYTL